jgi:hypothetical protein
VLVNSDTTQIAGTPAYRPLRESPRGRETTTASSDPAGNGGFLHLEENANATAGQGDEASYSWSAPPGTSILTV